MLEITCNLQWVQDEGEEGEQEQEQGEQEQEEEDQHSGPTFVLCNGNDDIEVWDDWLHKKWGMLSRHI